VQVGRALQHYSVEFVRFPRVLACLRAKDGQERLRVLASPVADAASFAPRPCLSRFQCDLRFA